MVIRALTVGTEMAHQIHIGVKIRYPAAGVKTVKRASSALSCRVNQFCEINHTVIAEWIAVCHVFSLPFLYLLRQNLSAWG